VEIKDFSEVLDTFDPIGLSDMDRVGLMNRIDSKYVFSAGRIPGLLLNLAGFYKVLEINSVRSFSYSTTYLDTSDFLFFRHHVTGKLERNKVRYRQYEATGVSFLEVKRKTNKNRTVKWRIKNSMPENNIHDAKAAEFLQKHIAINPALLKPVTINRFNRITLVGSGMNERVTIDYNLSFSDPSGNTAGLPHIAIAELKRESGAGNSQFSKVLKEFSIRSTGFSKYCVGASLLYDLPRRNTIKSKLLLINKIENEFTKHARA
jgi:hypothetical protein